MQQADEESESEQDEVCGEVQKHNGKKEEDCGDKNEQEEGREDDESEEEEIGGDDKVQEGTEAIK